jgi:hypothetical protein
MAQAGISGNKDFGCDAIIVAGAKEDGQACDNFCNLVYCAGTKLGGGSILKSMASKNCIRVFRSSNLQNPFRCTDTANRKKNASALYRYDGLYRVTKVSFADEDSGKKAYEQPEKLSLVVTGRQYHFYLSRVEAGTEACTNQMDDNKFLDHCRKLGRMAILKKEGAVTRSQLQRLEWS